MPVVSKLSVESQLKETPSGANSLISCKIQSLYSVNSSSFKSGIIPPTSKEELNLESENVPAPNTPEIISVSGLTLRDFPFSKIN